MVSWGDNSQLYTCMFIRTLNTNVSVNESVCPTNLHIDLCLIDAATDNWIKSIAGNDLIGN